MSAKAKRVGRGFWTGVVVGVALASILSRLRVDLNRAFGVMYNVIAPFYDRALQPLSSLQEGRQEVVDRLELKSGHRVLEVCVGTGANLPHIAERIGPTGKIYGIDISEGMLSQAKKKLTTIPCAVELRPGNAEHLPYPDDDFDAVLSFGAMNFITDRKKAIDEMVRVAKPGAKIAFCDETLTPDGLLRGLLRLIALSLVPRLRPPVELVPKAGARPAYIANGFMYVVDWRKPSAHA